MLELGANLDLDRPTPNRWNDMNGAVAVSGLFPLIDDGYLCERAFNSLHNLVLRDDIFHNQPAASDVLYLAKANRLAPKFFDDGSR